MNVTELPPYKPAVARIIYVARPEEFANAWETFFDPEMTFIGLDCEFGAEAEPGGQTVALMQLTSPRCTILYHQALMEGACYELMRRLSDTISALLESELPPEIVGLLENKEIMKCGFSVGCESYVHDDVCPIHVFCIGDAANIGKDFGIPVRSVVELRKLASKLKNVAGGLQDVVGSVLGMYLPKDFGTRGAWWEYLTSERIDCKCFA